MAEIDPITLRKLANLGHKKVKDFRRARYWMIKNFVGRWYGQNAYEAGDSIAKPLNMIYQSVCTLVPLIVFKNPKVFVTSKFPQYSDYAETLELAVNHIVDHIKLAEMLRKVVTDSMFMGGFVRRGIGLCNRGLEIDGQFYDLGQPCIDYVSSDDIIIDPNARSWNDQMILGNHYCASYDDMLALGVDASVLERISVQNFAEKRSSELGSSSVSQASESSELGKIFDFTDIYDRNSNRFLTYVRDGSGDATGEPILAKEFEGPEGLPYDMLGYAFPPDNLMPIPPVAMWSDMNRMLNDMTIKMGNQASRNKSVLAYEPDAWEDAQQVVDAPDGMAVRVQDVEGLKEIHLGGVNEDVYRYVEWAKQNFNQQAMNMDLLGGIQADQGTATQSTMMMQQSTLRVNDMVNQAYEFTARQVNYLAWHVHHDPYMTALPLTKKKNNQVTGTYFTPEIRQGEWMDYVLGVHPHSMERRDPVTQSKRILEFFSTVTPALAQAQQMLGPALRMDVAMRILGRYMGVDELEELISLPELDRVNALRLKTIEAGTEGPGKAAEMVRPGQTNPMQMGTLNGVTNEQAQETQQMAPQPQGAF
jgi:hypothetical protein